MLNLENNIYKDFKNSKLNTKLQVGQIIKELAIKYERSEEYLRCIISKILQFKMECNGRNK
ncbi:MAG: hypothetical protein EAX96_06490 [Candidatus Lokiarchaeota archaeon]|nr:hypothetical protein [Candidatus Lokiarchaeota archaeon]